MDLSAPQQILIATHNQGKIREIQEALLGLPIEFRYLSEFPNTPAVQEVGRTYEENAVLKAMGYSKLTGVSSLADDSGLEVDALGGEPGVFSARYAGKHASDAQRINKLLAALNERPGKKRTARFVCCMALAVGPQDRETANSNEPGLLKVTEGTCEGFISHAPRGSNGFGFDPVFVPVGYNETFAELPDEVKARISHRALALAAMRAFLTRGSTQT
jgi:XTP/dITP diphosphohydrolase